MSEPAAGLRRLADVVDTLQDAPLEVDSAQLLEVDENKLRGQLTVTVRDGDLDTVAGDELDNQPDTDQEEIAVDGEPEDTDEAEETVDLLDHTKTEDLELAYDEADGNISQASERFEVGYAAVYRRMKDHGVHETDSENGSSTEDDTESEPESEAPVDLEEDAADDAPAGTGDDVQETTDEITVDAVDGETDEPDIALPDGVTEADVQAAVNQHDGLGDVAADLGVSRGRARTITVSLGLYGDVQDIRRGGR
ncbi:hypothetical protein HALLA_12250 [Halostagnicola larsenii XH-48]|uniref:Uncharacterized protein n=2 Tax=Halostagnicola larsenii TaxID=353800 RepID=W0JQD7_9EURY|nr:hypothetical protein [Halostagnicola larsenii]AHG00941.1 hypothetical protein HALLA_11935 [Halostagnicola larsenii XH-48]AHG00993.1 hypothetical protein HALLA_12250 [Halostagnicola larsenii XH-48]